MQIEFAHPRLLLLLWLIPVIALWWRVTRLAGERALEAFIAPAMRARLAPPPRARRLTNLQMILALAGLTLALLAAARPQWGEQEQLVFQRGRDLVIALDVSRSMLVADVHPNRLQRAKTDLLDLIRELSGDRAALLAFRRKGALLCPLTTDYAFLRHALDGATPNSAPPGETDIGDAINKALDAFDPGAGSHKAMILISDGEDLRDEALTAAQRAADMGVAIFTIGIGSSAGGGIPQSGKEAAFQMHKGERVVSHLDETTLRRIAEITKGAYVPIGTASTATTTLGNLYRDHLRRLDARDIEERLQFRRIERFQQFLLPGLLLLLAATWLSQGRLAAGGRRAPATPAPGARRQTAATAASLAPLLLILCLLHPRPTIAAETNSTASTALTPSTPSAEPTDPQLREIPPGRTGARIAQKHFRAGDYAAAAEAYLQAADGATAALRDDLVYNAAVACYRAEQYARATTLLQSLDSARNPNEVRTATALGPALFQSAQQVDGQDAAAATERETLLTAAADAFRRAARLTDAQAADSQRRNLALTTKLARTAGEEARISKLLETYGSQPAGEILRKMLQEQRRINEDVAATSTNRGPDRLYRLEALSERQRVNADLWVPLKTKLIEAVSNQPDATNAQEQAAMMAQTVEATRDHMRHTADALRDLDTTAEDLSRQTEGTLYQLWKPIAPYESLLAEDVDRQTNIITMTQSATDGATISLEQEEALTLTKAFRERFTEAVPEEGNAPPAMTADPQGQIDATKQVAGDELTPEKRQRILTLTDEAEAAQHGVNDALTLGHRPQALFLQQEAYRLLKEIESLLPSSQQQQQQRDQEQEQEQKDASQDGSSSPEEQPAPPEPTDPDDSPDQSPPEPPSEQPEEAQAAESKDEPLPDDIERMLQRALQREREHQEEQLRRQSPFRSQPDERDW